MQTIWKGAVSFGLVSIPVRLYAATEERDVSFRQVHRSDGGRIRYKRVCELDGEEVPYRDIAKGYEMPDGEMVLLEKEDFESLPLTSSRVIDVLQFVPLDQLDPLMTARAYYLAADGPGAKPYVLLRDALERTGRAAIVKVALRNREQLAALSTRGDVLVLRTMLWPDEVRDAAGLAPDEGVTVRDQEVAMAESYIETLTGDFRPQDYTDEYRRALEELIQSKARGRPLEAAEVGRAAPDGNVVDLMAALRASVEAAKARRGEATGSAAATEVTKPPAKSRRASAPATGAAAKKAPAKKASSAKAPNKKAPAEKAPGEKAPVAPAKGATRARAAAPKPVAEETTAKKGSPRRARETA